jgi:hypothetical protein
MAGFVLEPKRNAAQSKKGVATEFVATPLN